MTRAPSRSPGFQQRSQSVFKSNYVSLLCGNPSSDCHRRARANRSLTGSSRCSLRPEPSPCPLLTRFPSLCSCPAGLPAAPGYAGPAATAGPWRLPCPVPECPSPRHLRGSLLHVHPSGPCLNVTFSGRPHSTYLTPYTICLLIYCVWRRSLI